jgi:hypothetical protein
MKCCHQSTRHGCNCASYSHASTVAPICLTHFGMLTFRCCHASLPAGYSALGEGSLPLVFVLMGNFHSKAASGEGWTSGSHDWLAFG